MKHLYVLLWLIPVLLSAQTQYKIMNYNLLNYPGNDTTIRNPYFRTTITATVPDILVCEEMTSQSGVDGFLNNVLLPVYSGYAAGPFINGPDTDSEIFYKSEFFTFISNTPIGTDLRNIYEFKLVENSSGDTLRIYSTHLKASSGSSNEQQRLAEVNVLRGVTDMLPPGSFFMVAGDFNIYGANEPAYTALLNQTNPGYFVDLFDMPGTWNDAAYAPYHTQSTRTRQFGGGANGGMDDRFDMILMSQSIIDTGGIHYVYNSYIPYGNDGLHYNDSINQPPNLAVGQEIANALHYSSDHLPVIAEFTFGSGVPVELTSFNASVENNDVYLNWTTATELNNRGFEVQRLEIKSQRSEGRSQSGRTPSEESGWKILGFVEGNGTTSSDHSYTYLDENVSPGKYLYRLKQVDLDGSYKYSKEIEVVTGSQLTFSLMQNYPNPFNPTTTISWQAPAAGWQTLKIYDVLGKEIATLVNEERPAGSYKMNFDASDLTSGIYFYKIQIGSYIQVKKMVLLK